LKKLPDVLLTVPPMGCMAINMKIATPQPFAHRVSLSLPLFTSHVRAGFPSPADDHVDKALDLNEHLIRNPASTFFVHVEGYSMVDAGITNGDILIVDRAETPQDKQIVVAMLDGEFTVKRFRRRGKRIWLAAGNVAFKDLELTDDSELTIWGVVTFIIHTAR